MQIWIKNNINNILGEDQKDYWPTRPQIKTQEEEGCLPCQQWQVLLGGQRGRPGDDSWPVSSHRGHSSDHSAEDKVGWFILKNSFKNRITRMRTTFSRYVNVCVECYGSRTRSGLRGLLDPDSESGSGSRCLKKVKMLNNDNQSWARNNSVTTM